MTMAAEKRRALARPDTGASLTFDLSRPGRTGILLPEAGAPPAPLPPASPAPAAGARGELGGILMIKAYLEERGETTRRRVLIPDSAHGTNPATAAMCGFEVVTIPSDRNGNQ